MAEFNPKSVLPDTFEYVDLESVVGTDLISHRTEMKDTAPSRAQQLAKLNDIFYQIVRPYQKNNYLFDLPYNSYVFSTGYAQIRPSIDSLFLFSKLQEDRFVKTVLDHCTGTSYPAINSKDLSDIAIKVPCDKAEQCRIGRTFKSLDPLITLHQRESYKQKMPIAGEKMAVGNAKEKELFSQYYARWVKMYKERAIRNITMQKYNMTQIWIEKLIPNLLVCELTRANYQQLLNDCAESHERQTTMDFHHLLKGAFWTRLMRA